MRNQNRSIIYHTTSVAGGMYTFKLEALSDDSVFYGGAYCSDVDENQIRSVKIGLGICTLEEKICRKQY